MYVPTNRNRCILSRLCYTPYRKLNADSEFYELLQTFFSGMFIMLTLCYSYIRYINNYSTVLSS